MDTYSSVVSANLHLQNGVTGSIFLSKKADRDAASIGTNPGPPVPNTFPLYGLPTKYDFFIFSRDHYWTLNGASFELIDMGYAMCLVDDGTGTGIRWRASTSTPTATTTSSSITSSTRPAAASSRRSRSRSSSK